MKNRIVISILISVSCLTNPSSFANTAIRDIFVGSTSGAYLTSSDGNPNCNFDLILRGANSLRMNGNPIWIVDGVVLNNSAYDNLNAFPGEEMIGPVSAINELNFISAAQVQDIEIIKGAAATALYGSLGANGVVIVTTKRGDSHGRIFDWTTRLDVGGGNSFHHEHTASLLNSDGKKRYALSAFYSRSSFADPECGNRNAGFKADFETQANRVVWFGVNTIVGFGKTDSVNSARYFGRPIFESDCSDRADDIRNVTSAYVQFNFNPHLIVKLEGGADFHNQSRFLWYGKESEFGQESNGAAGRLGKNLLSYNGKLSVLYSRFLNGSHRVKAGLEMFANGGLRKYSQSSGKGFAIADLGAKGISMASSKDDPYDYDMSCCTFGADVKADYSYRGWLNLSASLIADNTPKYDDWKTFSLYPSVSTSVDIRKALFDGFKPVSSLRIEGGYGKSGREFYMPAEAYSCFSSSPVPLIESGRAVYFDALDRLRTAQWDTKANIGFLADMIVLSVGWYDKRTSDTIFYYDNSQPAAGYADLLEYGSRKQLASHEARVENKGIELDADFLYSGGRDWSIGFSVCSAYNVNRILDVDSGELFAPESCGRQTSVNAERRSVGTFIGYELDRQGDYADLNGDGSISDADKTVLGSPLPLINGSFGLNATYGRFSLDAQFTGAAGFEVLNMNQMFSDAVEEVCRKYVQKGDYLRLNRVDISYHFQDVGVKWMKEASVNLGMRNVLTITPYKGTNPSANCWSRHAFSYGLDYGSYPVFRTVVLGVNLKF